MTLRYEIQRTSRFKRDFALVERRGCDISLLADVIRALARGETLPRQYRDHTLSGDYAEYRECHIRPDWLLIYKITEESLVLTLERTGTHSDLFKK